MTRLCFQAEVLTPLVIAGADPRNPEVLAEGLRPPSLRGAMRWWFRAMMGGIVGAHDNYKTLHNLEGKVFGATEQGSSVRLRTYPLEDVKADRAWLCMNDKRDLTKSGGKNYDRISKSSIQPNGKFRIQLDGHGIANEEMPLVLSSLWLTAMLGGLGNRSRRGFGSLTLSPDDADTTNAIQHLDLDFSYPDKLPDIAQWLEKGLKQAHGYFKSYAPPIGSPPPAQFPVLSNTQAKLWLIKPQNGFWATWDTVMDDLREHVYRAYKRDKSLSEIGSAKPRLASPLLIQIKRAAPNKYFGVILAFDEQYNKQNYLGTGWSDFIGFLKNITGYEYREVKLP